MRRTALVLGSAVFIVASLVLAGGGIHSRLADAATQQARRPGVGSWLLTLTPSSGAPATPVLFTLHGDGTMVASALPVASGGLLPAPSESATPSVAPSSSVPAPAASPSVSASSPGATEPLPVPSGAELTPSEVPGRSAAIFNSTGQGVWNAVGRGTFTFTYVVLQSDSTGAFFAKVAVSGSATVGDTGEANGSYTMRFSRPDAADFGAAGEALGSSSGTLEGDEVQQGLIPEFGITQEPGTLRIDFADQSSGHPTTWHWDFGDGSEGTGPNPRHTYGRPGEYEIFLTISNDQDTATTPTIITVGQVSRPRADFSTDQASGSLQMTFTDQSGGIPTEWIWDFGDGGNSSDRDPSHTYDKPGTYKVSLTILNDEGEDEVTKRVKVIGPPTADFSTGTTSDPRAVSFTDQSTGDPGFWDWDFGDGHMGSKPNPVHRYHTPGDYRVRLTVTNVYGSDTKFETVTVMAPAESPAPSGG